MLRLLLIYAAAKVFYCSESLPVQNGKFDRNQVNLPKRWRDIPNCSAHLTPRAATSIKTQVSKFHFAKSNFPLGYCRSHCGGYHCLRIKCLRRRHHITCYRTTPSNLNIKPILDYANLTSHSKIIQISLWYLSLMAYELPKEHQSTSQLSPATILSLYPRPLPLSVLPSLPSHRQHGVDLLPPKLSMST
jgi:hypothetical protein